MKEQRTSEKNPGNLINDKQSPGAQMRHFREQLFTASRWIREGRLQDAINLKMSDARNLLDYSTTLGDDNLALLEECYAEYFRVLNEVYTHYEKENDHASALTTLRTTLLANELFKRSTDKSILSEDQIDTAYKDQSRHYQKVLNARLNDESNPEGSLATNSSEFYYKKTPPSLDLLKFVNCGEKTKKLLQITHQTCQEKWGEKTALKKFNQVERDPKTGHAYLKIILAFIPPGHLENGQEKEAYGEAIYQLLTRHLGLASKNVLIKTRHGIIGNNDVYAKASAINLSDKKHPIGTVVVRGAIMNTLYARIQKIMNALKPQKQKTLELKAKKSIRTSRSSFNKDNFRNLTTGEQQLAQHINQTVSEHKKTLPIITQKDLVKKVRISNKYYSANRIVVTPPQSLTTKKKKEAYGKKIKSILTDKDRYSLWPHNVLLKKTNKVGSTSRTYGAYALRPTDSIGTVIVRGTTINRLRERAAFIKPLLNIKNAAPTPQVRDRLSTQEDQAEKATTPPRKRKNDSEAVAPPKETVDLPANTIPNKKQKSVQHTFSAQNPSGFFAKPQTDKANKSEDGNTPNLETEKPSCQ